jgi:hypothetical protein
VRSWIMWWRVDGRARSLQGPKRIACWCFTPGLKPRPRKEKRPKICLECSAEESMQLGGKRPDSTAVGGRCRLRAR